MDGTGGAEAPRGPDQVFDLTVALDYGQFYLTGVYQVDDDADPLLRLLEEAISGEGIAGTKGNEFVVVLSPHQNNFAMGLRVEIWPGEPPDDLDDWRQVFLTRLLVGPGGPVRRPYRRERVSELGLAWIDR